MSLVFSALDLQNFSLRRNKLKSYESWAIRAADLKKSRREVDKRG